MHRAVRYYFANTLGNMLTQPSAHSFASQPVTRRVPCPPLTSHVSQLRAWCIDAKEKDQVGGVRPSIPSYVFIKPFGMSAAYFGPWSMITHVFIVATCIFCSRYLNKVFTPDICLTKWRSDEAKLIIQFIKHHGMLVLGNIFTASMPWPWPRQ